MTGIFANSGENSDGTVSVECFQKKVIPFVYSGLLFHFAENSHRFFQPNESAIALESHSSVVKAKTLNSVQLTI